ncbi:hypothetical protein ACWCOP_00640 [Maricaulaceae bacterium MS644]
MAGESGKLFAVTAMLATAFTLIGYAVYASVLEPVVPALLFYAATEEGVRFTALRYAAGRQALKFWTIVWSVGAGFAVVEISNAFFPDQYRSEEAKAAPFALLAAFEFLFGLLIHGSLTAVMLALSKRIGWIIGVATALGLHVLWNAAMGA